MISSLLQKELGCLTSTPNELQNLEPTKKIARKEVLVYRNNASSARHNASKNQKQKLKTKARTKRYFKPRQKRPKARTNEKQ